MLLLLIFSKLPFTEQLVTKINAGGFEWHPGARTRCNATIRCTSAARKLQSFLSYLRVNNWRRCQESLQLFLLASHGECETAHTNQPLVTFQTWRNHRLRRIHWLGWGNLSLMIGSDELSLQRAANHRLWSSSEGCTDSKHRQEFLLLLDMSWKEKWKKMIRNFEIMLTENGLFHAAASLIDSLGCLLLLLQGGMCMDKYYVP